MVLLLRPFRISWTVKNSVHHVKPLASVLLKLCKKWTWNQKKMALNKFALSSWHTSKHEKCDAVLCLVSQLCPTLCDPMDCSLPGSSVHGDSPGKNTRVGCHALLQGIFPTQGLNPGLPHCRQILYPLSHQGSPRILEWLAFTFSRRSSWPRNQTGVPCIVGISLPTELPGKPLSWLCH